MELDETRCGDALKEPMYPDMGERPEFMPRTPKEVRRTYASRLAVVGNERQVGALRFPNFPSAEMKKAVREEGNLPMVEIKEQMPAAGYRVLQSVTTGDKFPLTFLRMQVGKTTPLAAAREAISLLGTTGLKDPTLPAVSLARGLARDRAEGGMQAPDSPRAMAREEHRRYTRYRLLQEAKAQGASHLGVRENGASKIRETIDSMSKEDLTAKIQQASTMIQVLKAELEPKAELNYWELLTRNLDAERALQGQCREWKGKPG